MSSEQPVPNSVERVSKHFELNRSVARIYGPLSLREALGLSQAEMGKALGHYTGKKGYTRATICVWERVERETRLPMRYAMTEQTRAAYRRLLADVVEDVSRHEYWVAANMGRRVWHFKLAAACAVCGTKFYPERWGTRRCKRHRRK